MARAMTTMSASARHEAAASSLPPAPFGFEDLVERIRAEFIEQPGLSLTEAQASRLWRLEPVTLRRALQPLIESAFLSRGPDGRYLRRSVV
jgi:hypothetical protein